MSLYTINDVFLLFHRIETNYVTFIDFALVDVRDASVPTSDLTGYGYYKI